MTVSKKELRDIFDTMGPPINSDEEYNEYWECIDNDQDGVVDYKDFKEFILMTRNDLVGARDSWIALPEANNCSPKKLLAAETLSALTNLFE